jgi:type VI secretion system protein ImpA
LIEIESMLRDIAPDAPCGEDLEYDPDYGALERATQGKPEQQFGDTVVPAEEPDWLDVQRKALALLDRTKDLRVVIPLIWALARTQGWTGFRDGLALLRGLLESYWDTIHPQLDPEDDNDPTLRVNTIAALIDPDRMLGGLRNAPLAQSRAFGRFCLRDVQVASGELPPTGDGEPPESQAIEAAFMEVDVEDLQGTANAVSQSIELLAGIESLLLERVGPTQAPDLEPLNTVLKAAQKVLADPISKRVGAPAAGNAFEQDDAVVTEGQTAGSGAVVPAAVGAIRTREDVIRVLDSICDYYGRYEPSSPVPILLRRARRLVAKDFMEILRDLAPDGVSQLEMIRGPNADES